MEKGLKKLNKMTMKDVWQYYNRSQKFKTQTKIEVDTQEQKRQFMEFWENLYADNLRRFDMHTLMDYMEHNYHMPNTPGP